MKEKLCLPLDELYSLEDMRARIEELQEYVGVFKIGKELFTRFGPQAIEIIKEYNKQVFLDLKFHDIPNTVKQAVRAAADLGVDIINVHASGGSTMLKAAVEGAKLGRTRPKVIGVTVLTSLDQEAFEKELHIREPIADHVLHLAKLCHECGLDGIVCAAADLENIRDRLPEDFFLITPGIKGPNTAAGSDQKRVMTPSKAIAYGSSLLVVGRAITAHEKKELRVQAARDVLADMASNQ